MPTNAWTRFGARPERRNRLVCAGKWFSCLLLLAAASAAHAQNDVVELTTGNRLLGTIRSLYRGELRFSIAGAGTVNINWSNVELLESARTMDVELASGERLSGAVSSPSAMQLEVTSEAGTRTLPMPDVVRIHPIEPLRLERLSGSLDLGLDALGANDEIDVTLNTSVEHRTVNWFSEGDLSIYFRELNDETAQDRKDLAVSTRRFVGNRWFVIGQLGWENDDALDLDKRALVGIGGGRTLIQSNRTILSLYAGFDYAVEDYDIVPETERSPELFGAVEWDWFEVGGDTELATKFSVYSNLDRDRELYQLDATLRREFFDDFYWSITVYEIFDRNPPEGAATDEDHGITLGLGREF